jgi:hypothetical protein
MLVKASDCRVPVAGLFIVEHGRFSAALCFEARLAPDQD